MKRTRIMGLCLVAVCAVFALTATSALALENLPHYGKCEKVKGPYSNSGCTKLAKVAEKEKYSWVPMGTKTVGFTSKKQTGSGKAVLEGASGSEITCEQQSQKEGEYGPEDQVKNVVGEFSGCQTSGFECNSEGKGKGLIDTFKLHGEPGIVEKLAKTEKNVDGNDLRAQSGTQLAKFVCGPVEVKVTGGVVVKAAQEGVNKTNKMLNKVTVEFIAEAPGKQVPEKWTPNGGGISNSEHKEIKENLVGEITGKAAENSGQSLKTVQTTSPKTTKVELRQCEDNGKNAVSCPK